MAESNTGAAAPAASSTPEQSAQKVIDSIPAKDASANTAVNESIDTEEATEEELAELAASDAATTTEKQEAKAELKRRMKFKVNGREVERDIDLNDEDALQELLQKGFAADERFQSASSLEKKMKEFAALLQADPYEALRAAGHDPDKLTEAYMQKRVEELAKSPEQLELEKLQKEIQDERKKREIL